MISLALAFVLQNQAPELTPAIYRCPAKEAVSEKLLSLREDDGFDALCIDPKPTADLVKSIQGKMKLFTPAQIDTKANLKWRNATIDFTSGKICPPKKWLELTSNLHETIHFLTSPATKDLRTVMGVIPVDPGGTYSARSVFSEMFLLFQPGRVCLTSTDIWKTREWPAPGKLESWILAMNDYLGPMLYMRHDNPAMVIGRPRIIQADTKPGLLIFSQGEGKKKLTFYVNNSMESITLPKVDMEKVTMNGGLNIDGPKPILLQGGYLIEGS